MALTLFRPVGPKELALIEQSGWRAFPSRLPEQPIFYPVTNEQYAIQIARDWNVKASGAGFVTRFQIDDAYAARFPRKIVGSSIHEELWVPAEELEEFNSRIIGPITVTHRFPGDQGGIQGANQPEGIWQPTYAELGGEEAPKMMLEKMEIELIHGNYTVRFGGEIYDQGHYTVDAASQLTLLGSKGPNAGRTIPGLFKVSGDTLSICYGLGGIRPEQFTTGTDPQLYLVNYTRKS
ncbi:MAG TPA: TIGR03067 domain-containing protein [Lacunisphaera sp.]|nr:TIGR03067 domain-containing protein [Lacunisphaera sp.]